jgi:hypothetical protein
VNEISACAFYPKVAPERFAVMEERLRRWHTEGTLLDALGTPALMAVFEPVAKGEQLTEVMGFPGSGGLYPDTESELHQSGA